MFEAYKAISRRCLEDLFSAGDLDDVADAIIAPNHTNHDPTVPDFTPGPEGLKKVAILYRDAFPDARFTVEDQLDDGDKVVTRWSIRGTHRGGFMGFYPTGSQVMVTGITIDCITDGKISESWSNYDALGIMQQIGAVNPPEAAATWAGEGELDHGHRGSEGGPPGRRASGGDGVAPGPGERAQAR